jgi:uncharacterized protein (DUF433 family)
MKQITIQVQNDQQVEQIKEVLSDFDFITSIEVDNLWFADRQVNEIIKIIETDNGPMISQSRVSVYDVMEAYDEGYTPRQIRDTYNLSFHQVDVALAYIEQHRATLEPKLKEIQQRAAEREKYYRQLEAERNAQFPTKMTPERKALQSLIEESRRKRGVA